MKRARSEERWQEEWVNDPEIWKAKMKDVKRVGSGWSCGSVGLLHTRCTTFKGSGMHSVHGGHRGVRDERHAAGHWSVGFLVTVVMRQWPN